MSTSKAKNSPAALVCGIYEPNFFLGPRRFATPQPSGIFCRIAFEQRGASLAFDGNYTC